MQRIYLTLFGLLMLSACSTTQRQGAPAPVINSGQSSQEESRTDGAVTITPLRQSGSFDSATSETKPATGRAASLLVERAGDQHRTGQLVAAARTLERALAIEPGNAKIWNQLAHVRADQNKYAMASQMAAKSNALAQGSDNQLKRDNWRLIAEMKKSQGDWAGARIAAERASAMK